MTGGVWVWERSVAILAMTGSAMALGSGNEIATSLRSSQ